MREIGAFFYLLGEFGEVQRKKRSTPLLSHFFGKKEE